MQGVSRNLSNPTSGYPMGGPGLCGARLGQGCLKADPKNKLKELFRPPRLGDAAFFYLPASRAAGGVFDSSEPGERRTHSHHRKSPQPLSIPRPNLQSDPRTDLEGRKLNMMVFCSSGPQIEDCRSGLFPDMPCMKRVDSDKYASVHWSAARNEERPPPRG